MSDSVIPPTESPSRSVRRTRILGALGVVGGVVLVAGGVIVWSVVSMQLRGESIVVPDDARAFQGQIVAGPFTALAQADIIQTHALAASGGQTYAELGQDDPVRETLKEASFLRGSLFTSVVAFGVSAFAIGVGILSIIFGWAIRRLAPAPVADRRTAVAAG